MEKDLIAADAAGKRRGEEFVKNLRPNGGTNINDALQASLKQFTDGGRPKMLVFMTDGLPTVGEANIDKIVSNVRAARKSGIRIFPFGFGYDVNTALLDKLGSENDGMSDYVQPKEDLEIKVSNFFTRVSSPVLSDINVDFGQVDTDLTYPRKVSNLFRGSQIAIIGRYQNTGDIDNAIISVKGKSGGENRSFAFGDLKFPLRGEQNDFLPRLWASRRVGWLIEQIRLNGETKELRDEVTELGTRYGIVTPYTSYLATDGSFRPVTTDDVRSGRAVPAAKALEAQSGAGAVQMSVQQNAMQANVSASAEKKKDAVEQILIQNSQLSQFVGNKNFQNQSNVWVDADYTEKIRLPERRLQFASTEYFELLKKEPGLAQYFALGEEVVVVWKNTVYRVSKQ
jgi:Ca-activated chloride channel family protein